MTSDPTFTGEYTSHADAMDSRASERVPLERLHEADLPRVFGRYELQSVLGEGGMARVFLAELRVLSPQMIVERISDRFKLLRGKQPWEQSALAQFSVFRSRKVISRARRSARSRPRRSWR